MPLLVFSNARLIEHLVAGYWLLIIRSFRAMHVGLEWSLLNGGLMEPDNN
jgi:hypothetical protein